MENIDNLSGRDLDMAVARAQGWRWMKIASISSRPFFPTYFEFVAPTISPEIMEALGGVVIEREGVSEDCPAICADIAAAWELDFEGARWHSDDRDYYLPGDIKVMRVWVELSDYRLFEGFAEWVNLEDKAAAYATARCRAWLKAQQAAGVTNEA